MMGWVLVTALVAMGSAGIALLALWLFARGLDDDSDVRRDWETERRRATLARWQARNEWDLRHQVKPPKDVA